MCGIIAIIGEFNINIIIDCLSKLQNRGYDSAGISIIDNTNKISTYKELNQEVNIIYN